MLSRRLVLYAGAAFFPLAALLAYGLYHDRQDSMQAARESLLRTTRVISVRHRQLIERTQNISALLSTLPDVRRGRMPQVNEVFAEVVRRYPEYPNVRLSGLNGRMLASALPNEPATSNAGRDWFDEVLRTSSFAMSRYFVGVTTGKPVVVLGYPVLDDTNALAYVLSITIDLHGLADSSTPDLPPGTVVTVLGRSGTLLATSATHRSTGAMVHPELLAAVRSGRPEGVIDIEHPDQSWLAAFVALPVASGSEGMAVAVEVPRDQLLVPVSRSVLLSGTGAFLVVALLFTAGTAGGRRLFVSPVRALLDVMSRLARGELTARPTEALLRDTTEFGDLARSLKSVAEQFQMRDAAQAADRARLQAIFDAFFGFATLLSPDGRIEEINIAPLQRRNLEREQVLGRSFVEAGTFSPDVSAQVDAMIARAAAGETVTAEVGPIHLGTTGRFVFSQFSPIRNGDGAIVNVVGFGIDISELKEAEQRLTELNATLEQRVADRARELEATNRELEAFSYSVSHDLRAPLRAIDGFSLALLEDEALRLSDSGRVDLQRIRSAAQRMGELIDALLHMSRLLREPMDLEPVDLSALANQVADDLTVASPARRTQIHVAPGLVATGDRRLLRAMLMNLIENALKFSAHEPDPRIEIGACEADGRSVIVVRDNGAGFDMAYADKLFVPFERLHRSGEFPGTGIGLATVHRIVSRHGGRIWAHGEPGRGATFFVELGRA
ncbi:MAG: ATP-binding protein [Vicinamibacterales bacterium]